ncbi:MAG: hypothetical protein QM723_04295 [Myxococcaceae bacterium]
MRSILFITLLALAACPSTPNPVCDSATHVDLVAKTSASCADLKQTNPLDQCELKIHGCTADDQTTLRAWLSCLNNLPDCTDKAAWQTQRATCDESLPGLSDTCQAQFFPGGVGGGAGGGAGGGSGGGSMGPDAGRETLPCDVAGIVGTYCGKCHSNPPDHAAPYSLVKRSDFTRAYPADMSTTMAARCAIRLQSEDQPMPPDPEPKPNAAEQQILLDWLTGGTPDGTCSPDAGEIDAGLAPVTCHGNLQPGPSTVASQNMDPGWACLSCHKGQNFQNQNPFGDFNSHEQYFFMGTVFPDWHEQDLCVDVQSGATINIFDVHGNLAFSMTPNGVGNFYRPSKLAGIDLPYTAQIVGPTGKSRWMLTGQAIGDCNTCHTEQGIGGAPGRIVVPQ